MSEQLLTLRLRNGETKRSIDRRWREVTGFQAPAGSPGWTRKTDPLRMVLAGNATARPKPRQCPHCGTETVIGYWVWLIKCPHCGCLISTVGAGEVSEQALEMQRAIVEASVKNEHATTQILQTRLKRLRSLEDIWAALGWAAAYQPPPRPTKKSEPGEVNEFLRIAWPASESDEATSALAYLTTRAWLAQTTAGSLGDSDDEGDKLVRLIRVHRVHIRHLPDYLNPVVHPAAADHIHRILGRAATHVALRCMRRRGESYELSDRAKHLIAVSRADAHQGHRRAPIDEILAAVSGTAEGRHYVRVALENLIHGGLVDYRQRAALAEDLRPVPIATLRRLSLFGVLDTDYLRQMARAWMQTDITESPDIGYTRDGYARRSRRSELIALDSQLDPEDRLVLHEFAQDWVSAVAGDIDRAHSRAAFSRRGLEAGHAS